MMRFGPPSLMAGFPYPGSVAVTPRFPLLNPDGAWMQAPCTRFRSSVLGVRSSALIRYRVPGARYPEPGTGHPSMS